MSHFTKCTTTLWTLALLGITHPSAATWLRGSYAQAHAATPNPPDRQGQDLSQSGPSPSAMDVAYPGSERLVELDALAKLPKELMAERIAQWQHEFRNQLLLNKQPLSDAALLALEALLMPSHDAAALLVGRYSASGFPPALRNALTFRSAAKLVQLAKPQGPRDTLAATIVRLHPFWWSQRGCMVSLNGVPLTPSETVQARPGSFFYIQRNCPYALDDRLATGTLPQGKDTVFIAFRAEEDPSSIGTAESDASHPITGGVVGGLLWGSWGKVKTKGSGNSPILPVGFRLLSNKGWSFHAGFAAAGQKTSPPEAPGSEPQAQHHSRLLVRALVEKRVLLEPHPTGGGFTWGPAFAAGINALHLSQNKSKSWEYSAPFAGFGIEATWRGPVWQDHQLEISLRPFLAAAVPPFRGSTKELSLVVGLSF